MEYFKNRLTLTNIFGLSIAHWTFLRVWEYLNKIKKEDFKEIFQSMCDILGSDDATFPTKRMQNLIWWRKWLSTLFKVHALPMKTILKNSYSSYLTMPEQFFYLNRLLVWSNLLTLFKGIVKWECTVYVICVSHMVSLHVLLKRDFFKFWFYEFLYELYYWVLVSSQKSWFTKLDI